MLIGRILKPHFVIGGTTVDRVQAFKLLGEHMSSDLKWKEHNSATVSKAASRLHILKQLKRASTPTTNLLYFYTAIVLPALEYTCPIWHCSLTAAQCDALEMVQKRAIRIIYSVWDYDNLLIVASIDRMSSRREVLPARFFKTQVLPGS